MIFTIESGKKDDTFRQLPDQILTGTGFNNHCCELASEINKFMGNARRQSRRAVSPAGRQAPLRGEDSVMGLPYKKNINDLRNHLLSRSLGFANRN